jgi:hypothetical protein
MDKQKTGSFTFTDASRNTKTIRRLDTLLAFTQDLIQKKLNVQLEKQTVDPQKKFFGNFLFKFFIYVRSKRNAERVMSNISRFIEVRGRFAPISKKITLDEFLPLRCLPRKAWEDLSRTGFGRWLHGSMSLDPDPATTWRGQQWATAGVRSCPPNTNHSFSTL